MPRQSASGTKSLGTLFLSSAGMQVRKAPRFHKRTDRQQGMSPRNTRWRRGYLDETFVSWTKKIKTKVPSAESQAGGPAVSWEGGKARQDLPRSAAASQCGWHNPDAACPSVFISLNRSWLMCVDSTLCRIYSLWANRRSFDWT